MTKLYCSRRMIWLAAAMAIVGRSGAMATVYTVPSGTTDTTQKSVGGTDVVDVQSSGTLSVNDTAIKWNDPSTDLVINNAGTIESTAVGGRAINAGGSATSPRTVTLNNAVGGVIQSQDDAFRINIDVTGGAVTVNNAGTIESTAGGQAIDFDGVTSTSNGEIQINNASTGVIKADDADGIRPGQGAVVTNAGLIYADGPVGESHDGVDFQSHTGTVINETGGMISGERHGVVSDVGITVYNAVGATILGRNGSGVNDDGSGTVINYGTITGAYDGSGTGDGDGVNIHAQAYVQNYGTINALGAAGVGNDGAPNYSDGVTGLLGSTIVNHVGALINSVSFGVVAGDQSYVENDGAITAGYAGIFLEGTTQITIVNSGVISAPGNYAIAGGPEDDYLYIEKGSQLTGIVDGGAGDNHLFLGDGAVFDTASNFQTLEVTGAATLSGDNTFTTTTVDPGATLQLGDGGTAGSVGGDILDNGVVAVDRSDVLTISSTISGSGGFAQIGSGTTILSGLNSYSGATVVTNGVLEVDGGLSASTVQVLSGTLSGVGTIAGLSASGGVVSPGIDGAVGALTVSGNAQLAGGRLVIPVAGDGVSSRLVVTANPGSGATGALALGGELSIVGQSGSTPRYGESFVIATAQGGVSGSFATIDNLSAVLYPVVTYTAGAVDVQLQARPYAAVINAASPVQTAYAQLLDQSRVNYAQMSQIYGALDALQQAPLQSTLEAMAPHAEITAATVARMEQDTLSQLYRGRIDASRGGAAASSGLAVIGQPFLLAEAGQDRGPMADHTASDASPAEIPVPQVHLPEGVSAFFAGGYLDGDGRPLPSAVSAGHQDDLDGWYVALGGEVAINSRLTVGAAIAYVQGEGDLLGASTAKDDLTQFAVYGSYLLPLGLFVDGQIGAGPDQIRTRRSFTAGGSTYDLGTHDEPISETAEVDLGKDVLLSHKIVLTPIAGLRYAHLEFGPTTETGGDAALAYARHDVDSFESRLGFDAKADFSVYGLKITPKLDAAYVHDFDADRQDFGATFAAGAGPAVNFLGPERSKDWAEVGGGAAVTRQNVTLNLDAETTIGRNDLSYQTYSASMSIRF